MSVFSLATEHQRQQSALTLLLEGELTAALVALVFGRRPTREQVRETVAGVYAPLVTQYGQASTALAGEFYDRMRVEAGERGRFEVPFVEPAPAEQIDLSVLRGLHTLPVAQSRPIAPGRPPRAGAASAPPRRQVRRRGPVTPSRPPDAPSQGPREQFDPDTDVIDLDRLAERQVVDLAGSAQRLAGQPGRQTLEQAITDDPAAVAWIRITDADPCAWCLMLASRGAVYRSRETAGAGTGEPFHDHDQCTVMPRFRTDRSPLPEANRRARKLWHESGGYFSGKEARNAFERAVRAQRAGRDVNAAVFDGPSTDPDRYRRLARGGGPQSRADDPRET